MEQQFTKTGSTHDQTKQTQSRESHAEDLFCSMPVHFFSGCFFVFFYFFNKLQLSNHVDVK